MPADRIVLDDLAAPHLPWWFRAADVAARATRRTARLDPEALVAAARRRTGLHDLGDERVVERLSVLVRSLEEEAGLTDIGRVMVRQLLVQLLVTRLRLTDVLERFPEILEVPIERPIVILGLPRTGTTYLHECLAADPALRSLPYWESLEPVPVAPTPPGATDPRIARAAASLRVLNAVMPLFPAMHEITAEGPHEEIQLLAVAMSSMLFEASYAVPSYAAWYRGADQTAAYGTMRVLLQFLQWERGGTRWVLKSPQHLEQLEPLRVTFPDATLVQTHRDPVSVVASMATMAAYTRRMQHRRVDPAAVGRQWADRIDVMLRASMRDRDALAAAEGGRDPVLDVRFDRFMADESATIAAVYAAADQQLDEQARAAVDRYRASHQRGRHGRIEYRLDALGLHRDELRERFRAYSERFEVPDEEPDEDPEEPSR